MDNIQQYISDTEVNDVDDFFTLICPQQQELFDDPYKLLYRGQSNAAWNLIPNIIRDNFTNRFENIACLKNHIADERVYWELNLLSSFIENCDQIGLPLPSDSPQLRQEQLEINNCMDQYVKNPYKWPNAKLFEYLSVAQHYGLPTRLLDWTYSPYVSAYFAAADILKRGADTTDEKLAIWI